MQASVECTSSCPTSIAPHPSWISKCNVRFERDTSVHVLVVNCVDLLSSEGCFITRRYGSGYLPGISTPSYDHESGISNSTRGKKNENAVVS